MRILALALFLIALGGITPAEARLYCPLPEDGIWINPDAKPKEISRIEIETRCIDDQVKARMRAFTSCAPRDCKWGWTQAELRDNGGLMVQLIGFLSAKQISVRSLGDMLDAYVIEISHDPKIPPTRETYNLRRK